jgi:hypothetical protein
MSKVSIENLPPEARDLAKKVCEAFELAKDRHEQSRRKWDRYYRLYRSYKDLKRTHADSRNRDVDSILRDAQHGFGADLFIPYVFSVIETTLPRMMSQNPRMLITPAPVSDLGAARRIEENIENMKLLIDRQQNKIGYNLVAQDVGKSGLTLGIGVQKTGWDKRYRDGRVVREPTVAEEGVDWVIGGVDAQGQPSQKLVYEGPVAEWVDPYDFIWDPRGWHLNRALGGHCRWVIFRSWCDNNELKQRIETGQWELPEGVELEDATSLGGGDARDEIWRDRMAAQGFSNVDTAADHLHEVWEYHDGDEVTTLLDRALPVMHGNNPHWHGEIPGQIYRPTRVPGEMLGIGEPEAIEDLQEEMNIMRGQRRDNAAIVLQRPFAYFEGLVDVADFEWGAGVGLPVDGDPSQLLHFFPVQDIPHSSYQEEANLQRDIERVTGIDDTVSGSEGGGGASATATGVQLVQAAAGIRIQNKTKLFEQECVKPAAGQFLMLNQQRILSTSYIPGPPKPGEAHRSWSWYEIGPAGLAGDMEIEPDGGSMAPPSHVEKVERSTRLWETFGQDPYVDPMWIREETLEGFGVENPRKHLIDPMGQIDPEALSMALEGVAADLGMDPAALMPLVDQRLEEAKQLQEAQAQEAEQQPQGAGPPADAQQPPA